MCKLDRRASNNCTHERCPRLHHGWDRGWTSILISDTSVATSSSVFKVSLYIAVIPIRSNVIPFSNQYHTFLATMLKSREIWTVLHGPHQPILQGTQSKSVLWLSHPGCFLRLPVSVLLPLHHSQSAIRWPGQRQCPDTCNEGGQYTYTHTCTSIYTQRCAL